ncbi:MAG: SapC family protein [Candidatus Parcubacteria bacterium]|nr:SapC family protein [Burkholderiales bacterium]
MSNPMFYVNPIPLSTAAHRNLKVKPSDDGWKFSGKTNSVLLAGTEFPEACKHFPIVFAKVSEKQVLPMALLGFRDFENLFVDSGGRWLGEYVPAYIRRYPFLLSQGGNSDVLTVCIDESYPGFGADEGQPLFDQDGESTAYLKEVIKFLQDYHVQLQRTDVFLRNLAEFDLLTDAAANAALPDGQRYSMTGLMTVDERKLQLLPDDQVQRLFRSGEMAWIYSHLISLGNFSRLVSKAASPEAAAASPDKNSAASKAAPLARPAPARKNPEPAQPTARK